MKHAMRMTLAQFSWKACWRVTLLCDAIRRDDERAVRSLSKALHGDETLVPK
jgi:hypothetical protein